MKPAHRRGTYHVDARRIRAHAYNNPDTVCQSPVCKGWGTRTLHEHPMTCTGKPPSWDAGHVIPGDPAGGLRPEVACCNRSEGERLKRGHTEPHTTPW